MGPVENLRDFVPNHFVPLLSRNMIYLSGTVNIKINFKDTIFFPLHIAGSNCLLCRKENLYLVMLKEFKISRWFEI